MWCVIALDGTLAVGPFGSEVAALSWIAQQDKTEDWKAMPMLVHWHIMVRS